MNIVKGDYDSLTLALVTAIKNGAISTDKIITIPNDWDKETLNNLSEKTSSLIEKTFPGRRFHAFVLNEIRKIFVKTDSGDEIDEEKNSLIAVVFRTLWVALKKS